MRRQGPLGWCLGEDGAGPHVGGLDGQAVEGHLLGLFRHEGLRSSTEVGGSERIQRLGRCHGRLRAGVVLDGPRRLLAVAGGLVGWEASEGIVALLGAEEGVVGVGVDDGAGRGPVDELALGEVLPDGGVWREDALGAGGGRHEDGGVEDGGVERGAVVEEDGRFPVDLAEGR